MTASYLSNVPKANNNFTKYKIVSPSVVKISTLCAFALSYINMVHAVM